MKNFFISACFAFFAFISFSSTCYGQVMVISDNLGCTSSYRSTTRQAIVECNEAAQVNRIKIINLGGEVVCDKPLNSLAPSEIPLDAVPNGYYTVWVETPNKLFSNTISVE